MAADKEFVLRLKVNADGSIEPVQNLGKKLDEVTDKTKNLGDTAKKSENGFKKLADGITKIGKATGVIALVAAAFNTIKSVIASTQSVSDLFAAGFGTLTDIIRDGFNFIIDNSGKVIDFFKQIFNDPVQALKDFGKAIVDNVIERFESFLDTLGFLAEGVKNLFQGEFQKALDSFASAGKEAVDVLTGVNNTVDQVTEAVVEGTAAIANYVSETFKANQELVKLQNNAKLAAAQQAKLAEQYDREAELQRQVRDNTSESIQTRIDANKKLGEILDKQEKAELASAQAQVAAASATFQHNKTIDNQVALTQALAGVDGVRAKIAGLRSEQLVNEIGLNKELNELYKTQIQSTTDLALNQQKFAADSIKNENDRLKAQRTVLEEEKKIQLERLQSEIDKYKEGTQDRVNAEIEFNAKKQELDQALATNAQAITDADITRINELKVLRAQNEFNGFQERRALLELEYAEKERLANGDAEKIVEIEKEKQEKIRLLQLETFQNNLELTQQGLNAIQGFLEADFTKTNQRLQAEKNSELTAFEESYARKFATVEKGSDAEKKLTEQANKDKENILKRNEKKQTEAAKKQFEVSKKMQLAGAIIDAAKAINASLAASPVAIGPVPNPAGIASLALAITTGAASIARIAATKFEAPAAAGNIATGGIEPPGEGGEGGGNVPAFNALNLDFLQNRPDQTPKAYVLAQDVSSAVEARDKVRDLARIN
jgi:hypothetical protein